MATAWWRDKDAVLYNNQYEEYDKAAADLVNIELIGVYFGTFSSKAARHLTTWVKKFHETCKVQNKKFEIVFCSMDEDEKDCINFVKNLHGNWFVIPWNNQKLRRNVRMMYNVLIQPALVVVKNNSEGSVVCYNAKNELFIYGTSCFDVWKEKSNKIVTESGD